MKFETQTDTYNTLEFDIVSYHLDEDNIILEDRINTMIYTDGELIETTLSDPETINEYFIGKVKYEYPVDTLHKKKVVIKNARYILAVTVANRTVRVGKNGFGWLKVIENTEIFLNNKKDKEALKNAKETIIAVSSHPRTVLEATFGRNNNMFDLKYESVGNKIYQLKR